MGSGGNSVYHITLKRTTLPRSNLPQSAGGKGKTKNMVGPKIVKSPVSPFKLQMEAYLWGFNVSRRTIFSF